MSNWTENDHPTPEQEREIEAREECARRGIDPDELVADGGVEAWMVVAKELALRPFSAIFPGRRVPPSPDVLAVHAQFGGDLADMQRRFEAAQSRSFVLPSEIKCTAAAGLNRELGFQTNVAIRARLRELAERPSMDDYDRSVLMLLDDFARCMVLIAALSDSNTRTTPEPA